jgi:hypothetical protein
MTVDTAAEEDRRRPSSRGLRVAVPTTVLLAVLALVFVVVMLAGRHLTFFYDEWDFILRRRGGSAGSFLDPHNGHIVLFEVAIYKALLATVGLHHYWPYQAINAVLDVLCGGLLYVLARRRIGPWGALVPTVMLIVMGAGYEDILWPFQIGWFASVAGGLGALALIERPSRRADIGACLLLIWSLTGSAVGIAFLVAALALILIGPGAWRDDRWRRIWIVVIPLVLFLIWYAGWGTSQQVTTDSVLGAPQYVATAAGGASAGLFGLSSSWDEATAVLVFGLIAIGLLRRGRLERAIPQIAAAALIGALIFWLLTAIARADYAQPDSSRYLYIGGALLLLAATEAAVGVPRPRAGALAVLAVLLIGILVSDVDSLRAGERSYRGVDTTVKVSLGALQVAGPLAASSFQPDPTGAPQISAGPFLAAESAVGSPGLTITQLASAPESEREQADTVIDQAEQTAATPATLPHRSQALSVDAAFGGMLKGAAPRCRRFVVHHGQTGSLDLTLAAPRTTVTMRASTASLLFYVRRFASVFSGNPTAQIAAGSTESVSFEPDADPQLTRHVQLVSTGAFTVCVGG